MALLVPCPAKAGNVRRPPRLKWLLRLRDALPGVGAERPRGQAFFVGQVRLRVVAPGKPHGHRLRHLVAVNDDRLALDLGRGVNELLIGAGDLNSESGLPSEAANPSPACWKQTRILSPSTAIDW